MLTTDINILEVSKAAKGVIRVTPKSETHETTINRFLDKILHYQKRLEFLTIKLSDLNTGLILDLENSTEQFKKLLPEIEKLLSVANKLVASIKKSPYYSGLKSHAKPFFIEVDQLAEIISDAKLKFELSDDSDINKLFDEITEML